MNMDLMLTLGTLVVVNHHVPERQSKFWFYWHVLRSIYVRQRRSYI